MSLCLMIFNKSDIALEACTWGEQVGPGIYLRGESVGGAGR